MAGASSAAHLSVAVVEGVHLALRSPVQEGRVAAGVVLDHARMQILNRLCLHGSPGTQSAQWSELSPAAPVITGFPGLGCIYLSIYTARANQSDQIRDAACCKHARHFSESERRRKAAHIVLRSIQRAAGWQGHLHS